MNVKRLFTWALAVVFIAESQCRWVCALEYGAPAAVTAGAAASAEHKCCGHSAPPCSSAHLGHSGDVAPAKTVIAAPPRLLFIALASSALTPAIDRAILNFQRPDLFADSPPPPRSCLRPRAPPSAFHA